MPVHAFLLWYDVLEIVSWPMYFYMYISYSVFLLSHLMSHQYLKEPLINTYCYLCCVVLFVWLVNSRNGNRMKICNLLVVNNRLILYRAHDKVFLSPKRWTGLEFEFLFLFVRNIVLRGVITVNLLQIEFIKNDFHSVENAHVWNNLKVDKVIFMLHA